MWKDTDVHGVVGKYKNGFSQNSMLLILHKIHSCSVGIIISLQLVRHKVQRYGNGPRICSKYKTGHQNLTEKLTV